MLLLVGAVGFFYFSTIREGHPWGDDFAQYIQHAENISAGAPYERILFVYDSRAHLGPRVYPPVFPLLLSPVCRWAGLNLTWMKRVVIGTFLLALWALFYAFREELSLTNRLTLLGLLGFSPYFWDFKDNVLSDLPFLLFVTVALILIESSWQENQSSLRAVGYGVLAGVAMYLAYGTRTIGAVLLPVVLLYSWVRSRKLTRFAGIAVGTCATLVVVQSFYLHNLGTYFDLYHYRVRTFTNGIFTYLGALGKIWDNGNSLPLAVVLYLFAGALAVIGAREQWRKRVRIWEIFSVFYFAAVCAWSERQGTRLMIPLIPLYLSYVLAGIEWVRIRKGPRWGRFAYGLLLGAIAITYAMKYSTLDFRVLRTGIAEPQAQELFGYIQAHTGEKDVIEFVQPRALSLLTGRKASVYYAHSSDNEMWSYLREGGVTYLTTAPLDQAFWRNFVAKNQQCWHEVFSNSQYHVYRVNRDADSRENVCGGTNR